METRWPEKLANRRILSLLIPRIFQVQVLRVTLPQAAYLANCAGGLVVMKEGAASINIPELKAAAAKETST